MLRIDGIIFEPPSGFEPSETLITLTTPAPAPTPAAEPAAAEGAPRRPRAVRPNLILQSRLARPGAELAILAGEYMAELAQSVGGMKDLTSVPFGFDDGVTGILLAYDFPVPAPGAAHAAGAKGAPASVMRQYHVLRLDDGRLTTVTLTVGTADLTPALGESYLRALASAKRVEGPARKAK
jgi:hypothetical protein